MLPNFHLIKLTFFFNSSDIKLKMNDILILYYNFGSDLISKPLSTTLVSRCVSKMLERKGYTGLAGWLPDFLKEIDA